MSSFTSPSRSTNGDGAASSRKQAALMVFVFVGFLAMWQLLVTGFRMHPVTLPSPLVVAHTMWSERDILTRGFIATGTSAILGLLLSVLLGVLVSIGFSQSKLVRTAFYPYVVFLQTVPIVAIAPLLITWFGYGFKTVVLVATIISLFPIVSNVTAGLISIDDNLKDLFRLSQATRWQTLIKLRIPHALGNLVLGMRISAGLAVIGAIVGEFFVGSGAQNYAGLGTVITGWQNLARTDAVIAAVFVSTLLGLVMLAVVNFFARICFGRWTAGGGFENE